MNAIKVEIEVPHLEAVRQPENDQAVVSRRLREVRTKMGLSVNELATKSSVSAGMISQIERGISSPSVKTLERLRTALDVPLTDLFSEGASDSEENFKARGEGNFVRRSASRPKFLVQASGLRKELLTPEGQHDLQFMLIHFDPGTSSSEVLMGAGEKGGMVLTGKLELMVDNHTVEIQEGDSFQFNSALAHRLRNVSRETASVIWFMDTRRPRVEM
ncbi:helix-turn-helix domain-containing protein [Pandoraea communis]|uniref:HTH-type transcriptional regulator SutR n=1 Tax=Pandoraea communis TaxID=2508297 RepID=A0A5E4YJH2_9BURK|nr:helix-turn-helix domain-containing protein [Pandoraea communis]MDM8356700.1 helix-turn-helix domain-containing protein [Pandoraea communis]VVE48438.1 HTH-type transcriptional regulator SutR [Pandoraea communis]